MVLLVLAAHADTPDPTEVLVARAKATLLDPPGCWVAEGHATWARRGWAASSKGETDFTAVLDDGEWVSTTLTNTTAGTVVYGAPTDRPTLRQFEFKFGTDPMGDSPTLDGLLAWRPRYTTGPPMRTRELPETRWVDEDAGTVTVHWAIAFDDGPGAAADWDRYAVYEDREGVPGLVGLRGQTFGPVPGLREHDRAEVGFEVHLGPEGFATTERSWNGGRAESDIVYRSFTACSPDARVPVSLYAPGAVFADEVDLFVAVESAVARERAQAEALAAAQRLRKARRGTVLGVLSVATAGAAGACAALCNETEFSRGLLVGEAVTAASLGVSLIATAALERRRVHRQHQERTAVESDAATDEE